MLDQLVDMLAAGGWKIVAVVALVLVGARLLRLVLAPRREDPHHVKVQCTCGWSGSVSRHHRTCPKCGNRIG